MGWLELLPLLRRLLPLLDRVAPMLESFVASRMGTRAALDNAAAGAQADLLLALQQHDERVQLLQSEVAELRTDNRVIMQRLDATVQTTLVLRKLLIVALSILALLIVLGVAMLRVILLR